MGKIIKPFQNSSFSLAQIWAINVLHFPYFIAVTADFYLQYNYFHLFPPLWFYQ